MSVDRWGLSEGQGASYVIQPFRVAGPGDFSGPLPMGVVVEEERGHSVGDVSMERGGVGGDSMFFPPFLSSIPVTLFNGGLLLTVLHLCCSLRLHPEYNDFRSRLGKLLRPPDASTTPITGEGPMGAALEVLRKAARSQALMDNVEDVLEILVHNATEEFGFIPRDVYDGIFRFHDTESRQTRALRRLQPARMEEIVQSFSDNYGPAFTVSHCVAAVFPRPSIHPLDSDDWAIDFKSIRIARRATELM